MNRKSISKFIYLLLISTVVSTPFYTLLNVQAIEGNLFMNENVNQEFPNIDDLLNLLKENQSTLNENEFEVKAEGYSAVINKETGNITHNFYDDDGVLVDSYTTNYYENIKNIFEEPMVSSSMLYRLNSLYRKISKHSQSQKMHAQNLEDKFKIILFKDTILK